uniref:Uncharacterized protein n=1 Tax=Mesocestoides corti TaxID=53468 RepID=A0A5K3FT45_MESCO
MACGNGRQKTRVGHDRGIVYGERRDQRGGLGWKVSDMWFWLVIGQQSLFCCTSLLPIRARVFYSGVV